MAVFRININNAPSSYSVNSTSGSYTFDVQVIGAGTVAVQVRLGSTVLYNNSSSYTAGETKTISINHTSILSAMPDTTSDTLRIIAIADTISASANSTITISSAIDSTITAFTASIPTISGTLRTPISGQYIRGYTTLRLSYTVNKAYGATSATLKIYSSTEGDIAEQTVTITNNETVNGYVDILLPERTDSFDYMTFVANLYDSRSSGLRGAKNTTVTVRGYTKPNITANGYRCRGSSDSTRDESGAYAYLTYSATFAYSGLSGYTSSVTLPYDGANRASGYIASQAVDVARTYTVEATDTVLRYGKNVLGYASDKVTKDIIVNMAKFPLDLYDDGNGNMGARVGGIAESGYFTCGLKQKGVFFYGTCSTARATARKVCSNVDPTFQLYRGVLVFIKFDYANGKANPTLKINNTTATSIKRYGTTAPSTSRASSWNAGSVVAFIYDGTYYQMVGYVNTTYSAISQANIETIRGTSTGLITGQRFTQGFDARLTKSAIYSVLGISGEKTVHLAGMSGYSYANDTMRVNIPIPPGATISVALDSSNTGATVGGGSSSTSVTLSGVSVIDTDVASASLAITFSGTPLTADRAYTFRNGQIKVTYS